MAGESGGKFPGNDAVTAAKNLARHTKDIARNLDQSAKSWSVLGGSISKASSEMDEASQLLAKVQKNIEKVGHESAADAKAVKDLTKEIDRLGKKLSGLKIAAKGLDLLSSGFEKIGKALFKAHTLLFSFGFDFLIDSVKRVYELQERWTKAIGAFNMKLGGLTSGIRGAQKAASQWEGTMYGLTDQFGQGIEMFSEFSLSFGKVIESGNQWSRFGLQLSRGFNLGAESAGQLTRAFSNMEMTSGDASVVIGEMSQGANLAGVSVNQLAKDVGEANDYMVRFGKQGAKAFVTSAAYARQFGMSMKELQKVTEKFDTFDEAAITSAKLNTTFGTMINSLDLLLEDDPAKRFETIRQQMLAQGQTYDTLTPKQIRYFSELTGMTEKQVAASLSLENANVSYADFMAKQQKEEQNEIKAKKQMEKALRSTAQTMYAFNQAFDRITVAIAKAIRPLLEVLGLAKKGGKDFKNFGQVMGSVTDHIVKFFEQLAGNDKWKAMMSELAKDLIKLGKAASDFIMSGKAVKVVGKIVDVMKDLYTFGRDAFGVMLDLGKKLMPVFETVFKYSKEIMIAFASFKALKGINGAISSLSDGKMGLLGLAKKGLSGTGSSAMGMLAGAGIGAGVGSLTGGGTAGGSIGGAALGALGMALGGPIGAAVGGAVGGWLGKHGQKIVEKLINNGPSMSGGQAEKAAEAKKEQLAIDEKINKLKTRQEQKDTFYSSLEEQARKQKLAEQAKEIEAHKENKKSVIDLTKKHKEYWKTVDKLREQAAQELEANIASIKSKQESESLGIKIMRMEDSLSDAKAEADKVKNKSLERADGETREQFHKRMLTLGRVSSLERDIAEARVKQSKLSLDSAEKEYQFKARYNILNANSQAFADFSKSAAAQGLEGAALQKAFIASRTDLGQYGADALKSFASGGIVRRPTYAMIGEAGPEAVIPLKAMARGKGRNPAAFGGESAKKIVNYAGGAQQSSKQEIILVGGDVILDGVKVGRHIVKQAISSRE